MSDIAERSLHTRIARSVEAIRRSFVDNLLYVTVRTFDNATTLDHYIALAYTIRDRLLARIIASDESYKRQDVKTVAYMSAEYLLGPHLGNNLLNLGLWVHVSQAMNELGAYSRPNWTRVPRQTGQPFQRKLDTDSTPNWTVIPA